MSIVVLRPCLEKKLIIRTEHDSLCWVNYLVDAFERLLRWHLCMSKSDFGAFFDNYDKREAADGISRPRTELMDETLPKDDHAVMFTIKIDCTKHHFTTYSSGYIISVLIHVMPEFSELRPSILSKWKKVQSGDVFCQQVGRRVDLSRSESWLCKKRTLFWRAQIDGAVQILVQQSRRQRKLYLSHYLP